MLRDQSLVPAMLSDQSLVPVLLLALIVILGLVLLGSVAMRLGAPWFQQQLRFWGEMKQLRTQMHPDSASSAGLAHPLFGGRRPQPPRRPYRALVWGSGFSQRRLRQLEVATPELLSFLSRALRAGHSLHAAIHWAGESFPGPLGEEFARISAQMRFGVEMNQALEAFVVRYPLGELRMFAAGLRIAEELGGPLPALLEQLARQIRLRLKLRARVKALSAEARWSAWFLGALPFVLALILSIWRPEHIAVLWNVENGRKLVSIALLLMTIGIFWMRRLVARVED
jgi:hypothetical protein